MSKAVRDRQHRTEYAGKVRGQVLLRGAVVDVTAYDDDVRMFEITPAVPSSAALAGRMHDGLLPTPSET